ncbi:MAG: NYN domain-containing protein [Planctomycetota bacterium]|jgi:predicted RNA-binding protein with PIN domain
MPIIIDGHNLLWSIHNASADRESIGDVRLCHILGRYLRLTGEKAELVFDGPGPPDKRPFDNIANLDVSFSGRDADADQVIEDKIAASTAPRALTLVSSDRKLRAAARARRAATVKSETFWAGVRQQFGRKSKNREPAAKRLGLSDCETEQWLRFFGLDR